MTAEEARCKTCRMRTFDPCDKCHECQREDAEKARNANYAQIRAEAFEEAARIAEEEAARQDRLSNRAAEDKQEAVVLTRNGAYFALLDIAAAIRERAKG
jgi:uncharacterized metal-binding protein